MTLKFKECHFSYNRWHRRPVLRNFSYVLPEGLTILLGPNGAGKSTLLKLAAGVNSPQSGTVALGGVDAREKDYRRAVAWMPQQIAPVSGLTVREYVAYLGWLKGMNKREAWGRAHEALKRVELTDREDMKTSQLSGGQLRRVGVAGALAHDAQILLLDEPTAGMDPRQRRVFRDILRELSANVQVLVATHDVADLAEDADTVSVMDHGSILATGSAPDFLSYASSDAAPGRVAESAYTAILCANGVG